MIPRKRLDIGASDLAFGLLACAGMAPRPKSLTREGEPLLCERADALVCLSVRSALDLLLTELAWPKGDEVLVSAVTIPDIGRILREHGLRPVPVDLDPATLAMRPDALDRAVTPRTRAVLVAHLFGGRLNLGPVIAWAGGKKLQVWEDCAQAFSGGAFHGHERSDVCFFSFGTIKTATALGGGVVLVRDADLRLRLAARHARWPVQSTASYFRRLLKFGAYVSLEQPWAYGLFFRFLESMGRDPDAFIMSFGRGFAGGNFFARLRQQPCSALRRMLARRLAGYDMARLQERARTGALVLSALRSVRPIGASAAHHTHWLFPLRVGNPQGLMQKLVEAGFDATEASSSMQALPEEAGIAAPHARAAMRQVLYVPVYPGIPEHKLVELAALLNAHAEPPRAA